MSYSKIVIALGGVGEEAIIIKKGFEIAERLNLQIEVIHINDLSVGGVHMMLDYIPRTSQEELEAVIVKADCDPSKIKFTIIDGHTPADGILEIIDRDDLLIMGHHKKNFFTRLFLDGVDDAIINKVNCSTLLIPLD